MKKLILISLALCFSTGSALAQSAKAARDFKESQVMPALKQAAEQYKKSCNGALDIKVAFEGFKSVDELRQVLHFSNTISENAPTYCSDQATRKVMGNLKSLTISHGQEVALTFANGKATATLDVSSYPSWDMLTAAVDR